MAGPDQNHMTFDMLTQPTAIPPAERAKTPNVLDDNPFAPTIKRHLQWMRRRGLRPSTIDQRRLCLGRLTRHHRGYDLFAVPEETLETFVDRLRGTDGMAAEIYHVKAFYSWAVEYGLIDHNPAARLQRPKVGRRLPRPIPTEELAYALANATGRARPILYLAAYAGLRAQDMCGLSVEDLRFDEHLIVVPEGKGGHEGIVDMCETLAVALRSSGLPRAGWLFPFADGRPGHLQGYRISQLANGELRRLGVTATLHQLRHWAGTEFYRATLDIRATQKFLRHQSITSTTIYTEVDRSATKAGVDALPVLGHPISEVIAPVHELRKTG